METGSDFNRLAELVKNSVVHIMATLQGQGRTLGSGFIISSDGYILTNAHIVEHAREIHVKMSTGREYEGEVIGSDARTDIALIKIKPGNILPVLAFGDSDTLRVGQRAGDLVTEVNAKKVNDTRELVLTIMSFHEGEKIEVKALTDRQEKTFSIVVDEKKDEVEASPAKEALE